jgi:hypothetical protein
MQYYIKNADKIKERYKEYDEARKHNPERIQQKKEIGKKYRESHREELKQKKKEYYSKNKSKNT